MSVPVVLDEDTYTEAISLIIERDFFPNLAKMRAQQNYLEAQHSGSFTELQEAGKSLHQISNQPKMSKEEPFSVKIYKKKDLLIKHVRYNKRFKSTCEFL